MRPRQNIKTNSKAAKLTGRISKITTTRPAILGRKSRRPKADDASDNERENKGQENQLDEMSYLEIMRRNFETQFGQVEGVNPIVVERSEPEKNKEDENSDDNQLDKEFQDDIDADFSDLENNDSDISLLDSDFEMPSELEDSGDESDGPLIVRFDQDDRSSGPVASKADRKLFMSNKAPLLEAVPLECNRRSRNTKTAPDDEINLEHDIALQRLIKESHILAEHGNDPSSSGFSGVDLSLQPMGKTRLKILESRIENLGAKSLKGDKMPMSVRKGIDAKNTDRRTKYEKHAKEAGIILSKPDFKNQEKKKIVKRDRGLKIQSIGRSTRGGLVISKEDIAKYTTKRRK
ncbi:hypothetical protein NADFUDRAFT_50796 [Nadsonia fulvescens var. elongata DSM 6958]|uniref:Protein FAF1 n=1 Tax=Nadsonia fulvescens var. elongata DSM 6958 TaxID=857566 RepID=A0A1E3PJY9_9ASCO|nr:hypothetical protein NADFUDRAFT_50796 [Nadsonia fulvescens var. elongata DSM 6958]